MTRVVFDTNLYIDWLNAGLHEDLMLGRGRIRYLSAVVLMELRAGATTRRAERALDQVMRAYASAGRLVAPTPGTYDRAGALLRTLRRQGGEVRHASFVNDVLIALTARAMGAVIYTRDADDFRAIGAAAGLPLAVVGRA